MGPEMGRNAMLCIWEGSTWQIGRVLFLLVSSSSSTHYICNLGCRAQNFKSDLEPEVLFHTSSARSALGLLGLAILFYFRLVLKSVLPGYIKESACLGVVAVVMARAWEELRRPNGGVQR